MKNIPTIFLFALFLFNCNYADDAPQKDILDGTWNLINVSGGFIGINDDYELGIITWVFNTTTSKLEVTNNNGLAGTIYDGLPTGQYDYAILQIESEFFLEINEGEFGGIVLTDDQLLLDQNKTQIGTGADGFALQFISN